MQPVGLVTWARLAPQAEAQLVDGGGLPHERDWSSGDRVWIVDVVAPFGGSRPMIDKVCRETLAGQIVRLLQPREGGGFDIVMLAQ
jgi:cytolysin-activating lysine-acyltransferase